MIAALLGLACSGKPPSLVPAGPGFAWRGRLQGAGFQVALGDADADGCDEAFVQSYMKGWIVPYHPQHGDIESIASSFMDETGGVYGHSPGWVGPAGDVSGDGLADLHTSRGLLIGESPLPNNLGFGLARLEVPDGWEICVADFDAFTDFCRRGEVLRGPVDVSSPEWVPDLEFLPEISGGLALAVDIPGRGERWLAVGTNAIRLLRVPDPGVVLPESELTEHTWTLPVGASAALVTRGSLRVVKSVVVRVLVGMERGAGGEAQYHVLDNVDETTLDAGNALVATPADWSHAALGDMDDDGLDDLLVAYRVGYDSYLDVFLAPFDGPRDRDAPDLRLGLTTDSLAAGDMDCDGRDDLLVGRTGLVRLIPGTELGELLDAARVADALPPGRLLR